MSVYKPPMPKPPVYPHEKIEFGATLEVAPGIHLLITGAR